MKRRQFRAATAIVALAALAAVISLSGCGGDANGTADTIGSGEDRTIGDEVTAFSLTSPDFEDGGSMPRSSACGDLDGDNISPGLAWGDAPDATSGYALMMEDEDPPCGSGDDACRHWAVFNIPANVTSLNPGQEISKIDGATQGENYSGNSGYAGPCPPNTHVYRFTVYALDGSMPDIPEGTALSRSQFESRYGDHILESQTLSGSFTP